MEIESENNLLSGSLNACEFGPSDFFVLFMIFGQNFGKTKVLFYFEWIYLQKKCKVKYNFHEFFHSFLWFCHKITFISIFFSYRLDVKKTHNNNFI